MLVVDFNSCLVRSISYILEIVCLQMNRYLHIYDMSNWYMLVCLDS